MTTSRQFTETEAYEKGFAEVFEKQIAPRLDGLEADRLALHDAWQRRLVITIGAAAFLLMAAALFSFITWGNYPNRIAAPILSSIPAIIAAIGGYFWLSRLSAKHGDSLRQVIVAAVTSFLVEIEYFREPGERFERKRFMKLGVIPPGSWRRYEDLFVGRYRETEYKMVDTQIYQSGSKNRSGRVVFDGLLFEIGVPMEFSGRVLIGRDIGSIGNAIKGFFKGAFAKQERVTFDDAAFEKRFAVYASDTEEAMRLVSPGFCKNMLALSDSYGGDALGAAFVDGVFLLAVPVDGNLFEPGSIKESVYDCEDDIHEFLREVTIAHRVIEQLQGGSS